MKKQSPIDRKRESSGHADVGTLEDGAIIETIEIAGRLLIIKERSIYEMVFADKVDPERTNINLPNTIHKLIIDKGTECEVVGRTFLTAKTIFKKEYLNDNIACDDVLGLSIDLLSELSQLEKEIKEYLDEENRVSIAYEKRRNKNVSFKLPSIVNLVSRCKTIFQKADHIEQTLMEIITNFYPYDKLTKQSHFPKFHKVLIKKYGKNDSFTKFINKTLYFMRVVRELRNGLDHRLSTYEITDFELKSDGNILSPTIQLSHKEVKVETTSLSDFFNLTINNLIEIIEVTFAYLAERAVRCNGLRYQLREIPIEKRRNKFVRFSFWMPLGNEGFYCQ